MIQTLKIVQAPHNSYVYKNVLTHNKEDLGENDIHIKFVDTIYKSVPVNIEKGSIGLSLCHRSKYGLTFEDCVNVAPYQPKERIIKNLRILINPQKKLKSILSIHEEEFIDIFRKAFSSHYFFDKQLLVMRIDSKNILIDVLSKEEGYINSSTNIDISVGDYYINLVSSHLLKRELFDDNFNFETIGIGGLNKQLVTVFRRALSTRAIKPSIVKKLGIKYVKGILLYGPPGTGKTLIARNIGNLLTNREPKIVNGPEILNRYVGQSEENLRNLFSEAIAEYREKKENSDLHIIIFDEIDAICKNRGRGGASSNVNDSLVNQLLTMIQGVNSPENIFIIAMTNRKDLLDPALLRAGRLEVHVEIGLPDYEGRKQIFRIHSNKMKNNNMVALDLDIDKLGQITENFSGAEIEAVVGGASSFAIHDLLSNKEGDIKDEDVLVKMEHFLRAVDEITPAFGNFNKDVKKLLPDKFIFFSENHRYVYDELFKSIVKSGRLKTILLFGENGVGKSTTAYQVAYQSKVKFTKIIRPIDIVTMDEYQRSNYIIDTVKDAYLSEKSLIVLDDIEVLINFANLDYNLSFSNKLYQTILTMVKTPPENPSHALTIIATCGDLKLCGILKKSFDETIELDNIEVEDVGRISSELGIKINNLMNKTYSIKELVNM